MTGPIWLRGGNGPSPFEPLLKHWRESIKREAYDARLRTCPKDETTPKFRAAEWKRARKWRKRLNDQASTLAGKGLPF